LDELDDLGEYRLFTDLARSDWDDLHLVFIENPSKCAAYSLAHIDSALPFNGVRWTVGEDARP